MAASFTKGLRSVYRLNDNFIFERLFRAHPCFTIFRSSGKLCTLHLKSVMKLVFYQGTVYIVRSACSGLLCSKVIDWIKAVGWTVFDQDELISIYLIPSKAENGSSLLHLSDLRESLPMKNSKWRIHQPILEHSFNGKLITQKSLASYLCTLYVPFMENPLWMKQSKTFAFCRASILLQGFFLQSKHKWSSWETNCFTK